MKTVMISSHLEKELQWLAPPIRFRNVFFFVVMTVTRRKYKKKNELAFICPPVRWYDFRHDWIH
jgi:hypothetical protein